MQGDERLHGFSFFFEVGGVELVSEFVLVWRYKLVVVQDESAVLVHVVVCVSLAGPRASAADPPMFRVSQPCLKVFPFETRTQCSESRNRHPVTAGPKTGRDMGGAVQSRQSDNNHTLHETTHTNDIAVAILYYSPKMKWYKKFPHKVAFAADKFQMKSKKLQAEMLLNHSDGVIVPDQIAIFRSGGKIKHYNHRGDTVPIRMVRILNETFPTANWLLIVDGDTCVNEKRLREELEFFDSRVPYFIGQPRSPIWDEKCDNKLLCCEATHLDVCRLPLAGVEKYYGHHGRPAIWPFGGGGYLLSRGLLHAIDVMKWRICEEKLSRDGGDVRVASCIWSALRITLTDLRMFNKNVSLHKSVC